MKQELSIPQIANKVRTEADAYLMLEGLRWADGVVCPHCASVAAHYFLKPANGTSRATRTGAKSERRVWKCKDCRRQFSVLTGTIFQGTKISIRTWLFVIFEMCASKNGVSAREIERKYDLTAKSAWFLTQRIREAMKREPLAGLLSGTIVADETFIGGKPGNMHRSKRPTWGHTNPKTAVLSLISQETGEVRSHVVPDVTGASLAKVIDANVNVTDSTLYTDESRSYVGLGPRFAAHETVNHSEWEYVRGVVTSNAAEGYFSQLKRSLDGTHHHVSTVHLPRYLAEFDFRYTHRETTDSARMRTVIDGSAGRRLTYRPLTGQ